MIKIEIIPNIGWNKINLKNKNKGCLKNSNEKFFTLYIHFFALRMKKIISSNSTFGKFKFCSSILQDNIEAFQFHPEKSGKMV